MTEAERVSSPLRPGCVRIWEVRLPGGGRDDAEMAGRAWRLLPDDERARADRMGDAGARRRFVYGRACLRSALAGLTGRAPRELRFRYGKHGRPFLPGGPSFSLSHSGDAALVAVTRGGRVGVDVERVRPVARMDAVAARRFAPAERAWLAAAPAGGRAEAFFRIWTRKEAFAKALGGGLAAPWRSFAVDAGEGAVRLAGLAVAGERIADWSLAGWSARPGVEAALAVRNGRIMVERSAWAWTADGLNSGGEAEAECRAARGTPKRAAEPVVSG